MLNILIIGTGTYVCGRGTNGFGTILPAIYEWKRLNKCGDLYIAGTNINSINILKQKIKGLNKLYEFNIDPKYFPSQDVYDSDAYMKAINEIPKPACAIIVVPDDCHRKIAGDVIENGLHTLVVKPLAPTYREVCDLIELQEKYKVYCAVEYHKRYDRSNIKLKDTITSGRIGEPLYFLVEYSQRKSIPLERFRSWVEKTNIFQYLGIHYVDIIYFATSASPLRVMATGQKDYLLSKGVNTYDSIQAVIEWKMPSEKIFTSVLFTNWIDPESSSAMSDQRIKVIGTKGRYEADQKRRGIFVVDDENGIEEPNPDFCSLFGTDRESFSFQGYGIESIVQFLKDVIGIEDGNTRVEDLEGLRPTFKESIIPTMILEAVNKSLNTDGQWIEIKFAGNSVTNLEGTFK